MCVSEIVLAGYFLEYILNATGLLKMTSLTNQSANLSYEGKSCASISQQICHMRGSLVPPSVSKSVI